MENAIHTVALFNASEDTLEMLSAVVTERGHRAVTGSADDVKAGRVDFVQFLEDEHPAGLVWDIAPPYDRNWNFFKLLKAVAELKGCATVVTTTNKTHLDELARQATGAIEIVGKPYDINAIVDAIEEAIASRGARVG